jgi:hypothetical protein
VDYGKVLKRAWEITWRWKVLWILGFLAALGNGGGGAGSSGSSSYSGDGSEWGYTFDHVPTETWVLIASIACLAILIGIAIWVVSIMARGGLIAGVQQVEDEGSTGFLQAWRVGRSRFWTLFGLEILATLPFLILLFLGMAVLAVLIIGGGATFDEAGAIVPGILCGIPLCCGGIILAIVLNQIRVYGDRAAILEGLGWIDAFKRGWEVLKANIGPTIIFWIIFLAIGLVIAIVIGGTILAAVIPFVAVFANTDPGPWIAAPICCGGLLAFLVFALIGSIVETFTSATWTLAYRDMTGLSAPAASEE